jgi:hypothetical protein
MKFLCKGFRDVGHGFLSMAIIFGFCLIATGAWAQASMGTLTGTVTDPQGAVVPSAKVEAKNLETNSVATAVTSAAGVYTIPSLKPGQYQVTASAPGFKKYANNGVTLQVSDRLQLDFKLQVGAVSETVQVTGQAPLLETGTASMGTVIAEEQINNLPVLNGNVMTLMRMTVGFVNTQGSTADGTTPWSSGTLSNYNVNGSDGFNAEYKLDGSPNTNREGQGDRNANQLSIVPPSDSVGEFKTQTNTYDAENGRSSGGSISISLKSGTNKWHGTLYEYFRNTMFNANSVANKLTKTDRSPMHWNQPGGMISGPVIKDKLFFMFSTESDIQHISNPLSIEVPTALEKQGNFSEHQRTIYDPNSTDTNTADACPPGPPAPGQTCNYGNRQTILAGPDNNYTIDPAYLQSHVSPVAQRILGYLPDPNLNAPFGQSNLNITPNMVFNLYHTYVGRLDYNINGKNTFFATYNHDNYHQTGGTQGFVPEVSNASKSYRYNDAVTLTLTSILKPNFIATSRIGYSRHVVKSVPYAWGYDPSNLGISGLPALNFPSIALTYSAGGGPGGPGGPPPGGGGPGGGTSGLIGSSGTSATYNNVYSGGETFSKVVGAHSLKFGGEFRTMLDNYLTPSSSSGSFTFDSTFTQQNYQTGDNSSGDPTASLLLGVATSGSVPVNVALAYCDHYYGLFIQDDWRVMSKLTLNLGLRWDYESPETERHDRAAVGFDNWTPYMIGDYQAIGGLIYAKGGNRMSYPRDFTKIQPRFGMAYQITKDLVFRGGWGLQASPTSSFPSTGDYTATTTFISSVNNNLTPNPDVSLSNPYPSGIAQPTGNSLGLLSYLGQSYSYYDSRHKTPTNHSFSAGFEYQLPFKMMISASYVGQRSSNHNVDSGFDANAIPWAQYEEWGKSGVLDQQVNNPFFNYVAVGSSLHTSTITNAQYLKPYPQFSGVTENGLNLAKRYYDGLQLQFEKRMSAGLMVMANYTWSKTQARDSYLNGGHDGINALFKQIIPSDRTKVYNIAASYNLPFFKHSNGIAKQTLGGWNASTTITYQSGQPVGQLMGMNWTGASLKPAHQSFNRWFNTCYTDTTGARVVGPGGCESDSETVAWNQLGPYDRKTTALFLGQVRSPATPLKAGINSSVYKDFPFLERYKATFRGEVYNLFNTPAYGGGFAGLGTNIGTPSFGTVTTTSAANEPRIFQFSLKLSF